MRWIIEGEWTGYTSAQRRVVHRTVHGQRDAALVEKVKTLRSILYDDGTRLLLCVREAKPRERVEEIRGYCSLIRDCVKHGVAAVKDLPR